MPIKIVPIPPEQYALDDLFNFDRWMCNICGLIFDYKFDIGEAGWPRFEPDLNVPDTMEDKAGNEYIVVEKRKEFCPRCSVSFDDSLPVTATVREVKTLSDFLREGDGEGTTHELEFKEDFSTDHIRNTMAAFAATHGGKIILGIDKQGVQVGYQGEEKIETAEGKDKLQLRIQGLTVNIDPKFQYRVYFVDNDDGKHFAVILVPKGPSPLYSINGKFYTREGTQTRALTTAEVLEITAHWHTSQRRSA